jgi:hypothetical protein
MTCALLAVARDEDRFLEEWINHHINLGFDHIYICDNNDAETPITITNEKVTIYPCHHINFSTNIHKAQCECYKMVLKDIDDKYDYCSIIDIDEFFDFRGLTLKKFIQSNIGAEFTVLEIPWETYTDNNLIHRPDGRVQDVYVEKCNKMPFAWCKNECSWGKSIFKLNKNIRSEAHWPVVSTMTKFKSNHIPHSIGVVKHYRTKCLEDFLDHKVKHQNFNIAPATKGGNIIKTYFSFNDINVDKIMYILTYVYDNKIKLTYDDKIFIKESLNKLNFITVVIRTHNRLPKLKHCIKSVLNQYYRPNILVLDDASDLETFEWCATKNIAYARFTQNCGPGEILMRGRHLIQTPYYIVLDDDDVWTNDNVINEMYDVIISHPNYDIYGDNYYHTGNIVKTDLLLKCPMVPAWARDDWYYSWVKNNGFICPVKISFNFYGYNEDYDSSQAHNTQLFNLRNILDDFYNQKNYKEIIKLINERYYKSTSKERKVMDNIKQYIVENNLQID